MLLENSGEIILEKMKRKAKAKTTPSRGCDMMKVKFDAVKTLLHRNLEF